MDVDVMPTVLLGSPEGDGEGRIFSLLFRECDSEATGLVKVSHLVDYIRRTQLQVPRPEGEESVDVCTYRWGEDNINLHSTIERQCR